MSKAKSGIDSVILRPAPGQDSEAIGVPRFALLDTPAPDPVALLLSPLLLASLLSLAGALGRVTGVAPPSRMETVALLLAAPSTMTDALTAQYTRAASLRLHPQTEPPGAVAPEADAAPAIANPDAPRVAAAKLLPPDPIEKAAPIPVQPEHAAPSAVPVPGAPHQPAPEPARPAPVNTQSVAIIPAPVAATRARNTDWNAPAPAPQSLGGVPLRRLIEDQDGLAAGLAALPSGQRSSLPRVSIRVNAEWLAALPQTRERLYFSVDTPQPDGEALAYLPDSHTFDLERPEHPLWQIHDAERVPALAELRRAAGRWLGASPELVGLYTWHPPVFEDALRMFVLERMQEMRVHLGPQDVVTVRLAPGSAGTVMNLEPISQESATN